MEHRRIDTSVFVVAVYAHFNIFLYTNQPLYYNALKAKKNPLIEDALMKLCQIRSDQRQVVLPTVVSSRSPGDFMQQHLHTAFQPPQVFLLKAFPHRL